MPRYTAAIDQGTTSTRFIIFDQHGASIACAQKEHRQIYPRAGWVEHDPEEIWRATQEVMQQAAAEGKISANDIAGIGITNQRETTILWDRKTGAPVYNAIVWQDKRTADICEDLKARGLTDYVRQNTGLVIDSYFSGTKIKWILDHVPDARRKAEAGELAFGT